MSQNLTFILAMSAVIPLLAAIIRYSTLQTNHRFFAVLMLLDIMMEIDYKLKYNPALVFSIYLVLSFGCFLYFLSENGFIKRRFLWIIILAVAISVVNYIFYTTICSPFENEIKNPVLLRSSYLLCFTALIILYLSINVLTRQITSLHGRLVDNCWFWISSGYTLIMSYNLLIFGLYIFAELNEEQGKVIGLIQHYVNVFCYLIFTIGILKMPNSQHGAGNKWIAK